eukprot:5729797-Amphidinium_carterae.2
MAVSWLKPYRGLPSWVKFKRVVHPCNKCKILLIRPPSARHGGGDVDQSTAQTQGNHMALTPVGPPMELIPRVARGADDSDMLS